MSKAAEGGGDTADGSASRPSKTDRQHDWAGFVAENVPSYSNYVEAFRDLDIEPSDLDDVPFDLDSFGDEAVHRPMSVEPGRKLREEATYETPTTTEAKEWHQTIDEWRLWYAAYRRKHIEFNSPDGELIRGQLQNSYQPQYGKKYYAKLKQLERGVKREFQQLTTVMLTFTASNESKHGEPRCPADHMRDIATGWKAARKTLHAILRGTNWEYARVWEPHKSGYGHLHVAVFFDGDASAAAFDRVMNSHVRNCPGASKEAHKTQGKDAAVSVNDSVENVGSYISEYIGIFGEDALSRPIKDQKFYATCWATGTRRLDFSNGAQDLIRDQEVYDEFSEDVFDERGHSVRSVYTERMFDRWRRENCPEWKPTYGNTVEPETPTTDGRRSESLGWLFNDASEDGGWQADRICTVNDSEPEYVPAGPGAVEMVAIGGDPPSPPPKQTDLSVS